MVLTNGLEDTTRKPIHQSVEDGNICHGTTHSKRVWSPIIDILFKDLNGDGDTGTYSVQGMELGLTLYLAGVIY